MPRVTVSLTDDLYKFLTREKSQAGHDNASLVAREALLLLAARRKRHEKHVRHIRRHRLTLAKKEGA